MRISDWSSDVCSSDLLLSGRPLYANDLINLSDAFVAGWLPGSEGKGVADVLFAGADGKPAHDFRGTLSFAWPGVACPGPRAEGPEIGRASCRERVCQSV